MKTEPLDGTREYVRGWLGEMVCALVRKGAWPDAERLTEATKRVDKLAGACRHEEMDVEVGDVLGGVDPKVLEVTLTLKCAACKAMWMREVSVRIPSRASLHWLPPPDKEGREDAGDPTSPHPRPSHRPPAWIAPHEE